jgi:catechol 2,3-dioxygenase-like lactoylglutathione lyase family enzyme
MRDCVTIPVLPCSELPEALRFYRALGFEVTYEQTKPNVYAATRRGNVQLHFMGIKNLDPARNFTTCLVMVAELEALHGSLSAGLAQAYGRVPNSAHDYNPSSTASSRSIGRRGDRRRSRRRRTTP